MPLAKERYGRCHEERCEQAHRDLRGTVLHVGTVAGVVARESPTGARQLQQHGRDQGDTDEHVERHERVHAEQDRRQLDENRNEQEQPDRRGEPLVPDGIRPTLGLLHEPIMNEAPLLTSLSGLRA